jgi:integrase
MIRRGFGDDAIYFDRSGDCRGARYHKGCPGRWRGAVSLGYGPDGKRICRKVGVRTKQEVKDKLEELHAVLTAGIAAPDGRYTVGQAIEDWLRDDLDGRAAKTLTLYRGALKPFADHIGRKPLRELTAQDVRGVLTDLAAAHSTRTVVVAHNAIERAIRHAEANDYVRRNVASLVRPPTGRPGRPSKSLTFDQASSLMAAANGSPLGAYVVLCLLTGIRAEEARALTWQHDVGDVQPQAHVRVGGNVGDRLLVVPRVDQDAVIRQVQGPHRYAVRSPSGSTVVNHAMRLFSNRLRTCARRSH